MFSYLVIVNIPQINIWHPKDVNSVANIITHAMNTVTNRCSRIKQKYLSWSAKYSIGNNKRRGRDSFLGRVTSRILDEDWIRINDIKAKATITKRRYEMYYYFNCRAFYLNSYYLTSQFRQLVHMLKKYQVDYIAARYALCI